MAIRIPDMSQHRFAVKPYRIDYPVDNVLMGTSADYEGAKAMARKLSKQTGKCYRVDNTDGRIMFIAVEPRRACGAQK